MNPFPPELRTAAIIPRWSVVWTLNKDVVSSHSFFVTLYARQVAGLIGWRGNMANLMTAALLHDLEENISGDLVSPVKREILDRPRANAYFRIKMLERMPAMVALMDDISKSNGIDEIDAIVTAADRLDALLFLTVEQRMGNRHVFSRCRDAEERLHDAWVALPVPMHASWNYLDELWVSVVKPAIAEHESGGGSGV